MSGQILPIYSVSGEYRREMCTKGHILLAFEVDTTSHTNVEHR